MDELTLIKSYAEEIQEAAGDLHDRLLASDHRAVAHAMSVRAASIRQLAEQGEQLMRSSQSGWQGLSDAHGTIRELEARIEDLEAETTALRLRLRRALAAWEQSNMADLNRYLREEG